MAIISHDVQRWYVCEYDFLLGVTLEEGCSLCALLCVTSLGASGWQATM